MVKEPWHAVSVVAGANACPAALGLRGKRALSNDAPRLPLPNCAWSWKCQCTYRHYPDRRTIVRRGADRGLSSGMVRRERRGSVGRRQDDSVHD
jgi:hypothetical protein